MPGLETAAESFDAVLKGGVENLVAKSRPSVTVSEKLTLFNADEGDGDDDEAQDAEGDDVLDDDDEAPKDDDSDEPDDNESGDEDEEENSKDEEEFVVKVDGEEKKVSLKEALDGYIRQETFNQRLNKVNEAAKSLEAFAKETSSTRAKYVSLAQDMEDQLSVLVKEPDWDILFKNDPVNARELQKQHEEFRTKFQQLRSDREKAVKEEEQEYIHNLEQFALTERDEMYKKTPEWQDPKIRVRELESMRRTAKQEGFTDDEIDSVYASKMLRLLLKASRYDRIMARDPKAKTVKAPSATNTVGTKRTAVSSVDRSEKRLARTGSVRDAASVFQKLIK